MLADAGYTQVRRVAREAAPINIVLEARPVSKPPFACRRPALAAQLEAAQPWAGRLPDV